MVLHLFFLWKVPACYSMFFGWFSKGFLCTFYRKFVSLPNNTKYMFRKFFWVNLKVLNLLGISVWEGYRPEGSVLIKSVCVCVLLYNTKCYKYSKTNTKVNIYMFDLKDIYNYISRIVNKSVISKGHARKVWIVIRNVLWQHSVLINKLFGIYSFWKSSILMGDTFFCPFQTFKLTLKQ